jgi:type I restriction-modification system DNA methylase subunit
MKKEEMNDINQYLIPHLEKIGISRDNCKVDVTTAKSKSKRGDVWISTKNQNNLISFEKNIIGLIEAKHKNATIGDMEWRDAMRQGKEKALKQNLNYYIVTNCKSNFRIYNAHNDEEIWVDGKILTKIESMEVLKKIQSQVSSENSYVTHKTTMELVPLYESKFRSTLKVLADVYRSAGLKKGDERIDPTVSFVVLKYISEKEREKRELSPRINLWDDLRKISNSDGDLKAGFKTIVDQIWGDDSEYKNNIYKDFKDLISFPQKLKNEHFKRIYEELDINYHFHGANFDLFGAIYEEFASQTKKKEFGEFYTRRHITSMATGLLLRNEINPRTLNICDPACGTGGFLTEGYKTLVVNYSSIGKLDNKTKKNLQEKVFWGYDNDEKSVARTKLNMFLAGDGHVHIYEVDDSLIKFDNSIGWIENKFDYIMTNPPMGKYDGEASVEDFIFTNEKRYELLFVEKVIKATKYGGEIAIVINDGALEAPSRENFRKNLLENCNVSAIISLTKFAFAPYTKEKTYILFMQKKLEDEMGEIQKYPIWHFILDYDGFANSDKRYRTKYHDDLPELVDLFDPAIKLARDYTSNKEEFERKKNNFEREVHIREKDEELWGMKCKFVDMADVNEENFYNLLSEFHLRNLEIKGISINEAKKCFNEIIKELGGILNEY